MALRKPLYLDSQENLRVMGDVDVDRIITEGVRQRALFGKVPLSVGGPGGNLPSLSDTRLAASIGRTSPTNFLTPTALQNVTVEFDLLNQDSSISNIQNVTGNGYPLYIDEAGDIKSMSKQDCVDTFVNPAIERIMSTSLAESDGSGKYFVSPNINDSSGILVSTTPFFTDTRADSAEYTAATLFEAQDQPKTVTSYYLYEIPVVQEQKYAKPVYARPDGNFQVYEDSDFRRLIGNEVIAEIGTLNYTIDSAAAPGINLGSAIVNTRLDGTEGTTAFRRVNSNDYRSQRFPFGVPEVISTQYLKLIRT